MLKVIDRFTTQDGRWYVSDKPYGIDKDSLLKYINEDIPGRGAATHIFVKVPADAYVVEFNTSDRKNKTEVFDKGGEWISFPMFHTSSYNPDVGEVGPWHVRIDGEIVADGLGLPHSEHVSTFLVVADVEPVVPEVPDKSTDKIQLIINGVAVWSN